MKSLNDQLKEAFEARKLSAETVSIWSPSLGNRFLGAKLSMGAMVAVIAVILGVYWAQFSPSTILSEAIVLHQKPRPDLVAMNSWDAAEHWFASNAHNVNFPPKIIAENTIKSVGFCRIKGQVTPYIRTRSGHSIFIVSDSLEIDSNEVGRYPIQVISLESNGVVLKVSDA